MAARDTHEFFERMSMVLKCIRSVAAQAYATLDLGSAQAKFLRHIRLHSRISQAELARATQTAPTLTGRALEPLIERGWVRRERSEEDGRQYVLELTAAGHRMSERVEQAREGIIARMATVLDQRDLEDFERIARKLLEEFDEANGPTPKS
jgi:DNA-binding MarR family transcriptional regulator